MPPSDKDMLDWLENYHTIPSAHEWCRAGWGLQCVHKWGVGWSVGFSLDPYSPQFPTLREALVAVMERVP